MCEPQLSEFPNCTDTLNPRDSVLPSHPLISVLPRRQKRNKSNVGVFVSPLGLVFNARMKQRVRNASNQIPLYFRRGEIVYVAYEEGYLTELLTSITDLAFLSLPGKEYFFKQYNTMQSSKPCDACNDTEYKTQQTSCFSSCSRTLQIEK